MNKKVKRRVLFLFLFIMIIGSYLVYNVINYWTRIYDNYQEKNNLSLELAELLDTEEELRTEAIKLEDPEYVAKYAREKLLYSKDGEIIFKIIKK